MSAQRSTVGLRLRPDVLIVATVFLAATAAAAADLLPQQRSDLQRGVAAAGAKTSDQPALRLEAKAREPTTSYKLGAALAAWKNAATALDYDLKNPSGDGDDTAAISADCDDERTTFLDLEADRQRLGLNPPETLVAAGGFPPEVATAWRSREAARPNACR